MGLAIYRIGCTDPLFHLYTNIILQFPWLSEFVPRIFNIRQWLIKQHRMKFFQIDIVIIVFARCYIHYKQKVKDIILISQILGKHCKTITVGHSILEGFIAGSETQTKTTLQCTISMYWVSGFLHPYYRGFASHRDCLLNATKMFFIG